MKRPAKKGVNKGILGAIGAAVLGIAAGAAAVFLSKEENRDKVKKVVDTGMKKGRVGVANAQRTVKRLEIKGKKALKKLR